MSFDFKKMEGVKQLLTPTRFSVFGYTIIVLFASTGIAFIGITSKLRISERRKFLCDFPDGLSGRNFHQAQCFEKYERQYNSPLPLYGSVLLSFSVILIVCFIYSWCCVKSWIDKLEAVLTPDAENPRPRPRVKSRRIFSFYFLHLAARLVLGIALTAVQKFIMHPSGFPVGFTCVLKATQPGNVTGNERKALCHNPVASEKNTCLAAVWILQSVFAFLVLGEILYLALRALNRPTFTFDSEFCVRYFFHKSKTAVTSGGLRERMKKRILQQTELLEPLIHCNDENDGEGRIYLDDIFLDVVIYTGRAKEEFLKQCERHLIYDFYLKPESQRGSVVVNTRAELFLPNVDVQNPRKILVVGRPGIGKSLLCERLLRDWSRGELFHDKKRQFKYAFLFPFRSFFAKSDEKICLRKLLTRASNLDGDLDDHVFQEMLDHSEKILLVFDGLDEFKDHKSCTVNDASRYGNSYSEEMSPSALYVKLLQELLLPGAAVLTTSRPTVLESLGISLFERTVEIVGFTEERVRSYVQSYCKHDKKNNTTATRMWEHIQHNLTLLSLCYIPVNCRIVCFLLKELIKLSYQNSIALPTRLTEIYQGALRLLIFKHHPEYREKPFLGNEGFSETVEKHLSDLGMLAMKGIAEGRMIFGLKEVGEMKNCGLLNQMPDYRVSLVEFEQCFCFTHLTLQEFLAAREIAKMDPHKLSEFIATNAEDPRWHLVIQFVAGLLHGQKNEAANSFVCRLQDTLLSTSFNRKKALLMMKCLYEYNDEATVNRAAFELQRKNNFDKEIRLVNSQITPTDCVAIVYFLKHIDSIDYKLDLSRNFIGEGGCNELAKLLSEGGPVKLHVPENKITDRGLNALAQAITSDRCKLKELNIILNDLLRPEGFSHLWESFKNRNCKVIRLRLGGDQVTDKVILQLCDTMENVSCKLTILSIFSEEVANETVLLRLCKTLKQPNCQLTDLSINCNRMTNEGVYHICDALENQHCKLTDLHLISNRLTAVVVPLLCKAIRHNNCKLTSLKVTSWNITWDKGGRDLQDAVEAKCRAQTQISPQK